MPVHSPTLQQSSLPQSSQCTLHWVFWLSPWCQRYAKLWPCAPINPPTSSCSALPPVSSCTAKFWLQCQNWGSDQAMMWRCMILGMWEGGGPRIYPLIPSFPENGASPNTPILIKHLETHANEAMLSQLHPSLPHDIHSPLDYLYLHLHCFHLHLSADHDGNEWCW